MPPNSLVFEVPEETKIRPDGVGAPTPEDLLVSETTGPYELVSSAVSVAIRSLESLQLAMLETARAFDAGDVAQGNRRLVSLATGLRLLTTLADVAARAARLNLTELSGAPGNGPLDAMGAALDQLSSQQFVEDYSGLSRTLVDRVAPALAGWREVFADILIHADFHFRERPACS